MTFFDIRPGSGNRRQPGSRAQERMAADGLDPAGFAMTLLTFAPASDAADRRRAPGRFAMPAKCLLSLQRHQGLLPGRRPSRARRGQDCRPRRARPRHARYDHMVEQHGHQLHHRYRHWHDWRHSARRSEIVRLGGGGNKSTPISDRLDGPNSRASTFARSSWMTTAMAGKRHSSHGRQQP